MLIMFSWTIAIISFISHCAAAAGWNSAFWEKKVNEHNLRTDVSWKAGLALSINYANPAALQALIGAKRNPDVKAETSIYQGTGRRLQTFPPSFDLRGKYPKCWSLFFIRNQGTCGSCWAFATMTSISDRICMQTYGQVNPVQRSYSYQDMLECCPTAYCGVDPNAGGGCGGGFPDGAMAWARDVGVVTGEQYGNNTLCKSFWLSPFAPQPRSSPACSKVCSAASGKVYKNDVKKIKTYMVYGNWQFTGSQMITAAKTAIFRRGTIVSFLNIFADFYTYKSGIYTVTWGSIQGAHVVRMIGWGVSATGVPYWICANSWGSSWGMNGYVWIKMGTNEASIEEYMVEGLA